MAGDTAAALKSGAHHRKACIGRDVERRAVSLGLIGCQPLIVDTVQPVRMDMAPEALHIMHAVRQHHHAALREHDVVVQLLAQPLPQLNRVLVEPGALVIEIVRPDDGGVAAGVSASEPPLVDDGNPRNTMFLGEVVGRAQPMSPSADDHDVVFRFGLGVRPLRLPALVARQRLRNQNG